ncbi:MAG TPA: efflux RND transporter periplasmic adaptor subunit [Longimicrobiales bacterium]|nr:efflux RND transporter periplasmic adaptor subunit [Longimicrobiales bacterium]
MIRSSNRALLVAGATALASATVALVTGCGAPAQSASSAAATETVRTVTVEVQEVVPEPFIDYVRLVGVVLANRDVTVAAEEGGVLRQIFVDKGTEVTAGQPIFKIDDELLQAQVAQAEANARLARETYERQRRLWEEEEVGSELTYLQARYAAEAAEAQAALLATRLERTTVRAPISGILDARLVEVGAMVGAGSPVARIVDVSTVKIAAGVPERYAGEIRRGADAVVELAVMGGRTFQGKLSFVGTAVDDGSRTFPIEIEVENDDGALVPGLVANIGVARQVLDSAIVVPQEAILRAEEGYIVYVAVQRDGAWRAEARPVVAGASRAGRVQVNSGLQPGDRVVVVGQQQVTAGDYLNIAGGDRQ